MKGWKQKMDARFPEVKVALLGINKDQTGQALGPLTRTEVRKTIKDMLNIQNLSKIEIHPFPKNESHQLYSIFKDRMDIH